MAVRAGGATDPASRIERLMAGQERGFRDTWLRAIAVIRDGRTLDDLADLLAQGRFEEALDRLEEAAALLGSFAGEALAAAARDTAVFLSSALTVTVAFDGTNVRAVQAMQSNRLRLIREFTADQRDTLRQAMTRGIEEGMNPRDQARLFRDSVGLTARQEAAVANFRRLLSGQARLDGLPSMQVLDRQLRDRRFDRTVERAIRRGDPLTPEQVDRMVSRYRERYIAYRAETIGRTEALHSAHQGTEEMYLQAIESGAVEPSALRRKWVSARDKRVRDSHARMNGQERMIGEEFRSDSGPIRYPGDPDAPAEETVQCRCVLSTRLEG
jgi:hypothetical protein